MSLRSSKLNLARRLFVLLCGVVVGVCLPLGIAAAVSTAYFPFSRMTIRVAAGSRTFQQHCSSCHTLRDDVPSRMGPSLANIGEIASSRRPGMSASAYLLESIVDPAAFRASSATGQMPPYIAAELSSNEIRNVVAFLASQGGTPDYHELAQADIRTQLPTDEPQRKTDWRLVEKGRRIYSGSGQCSNCHPLDSLPGSDLLAPSIVKAGQHREEFLRQTLRDPNHHVAAGYEQATVVLQDGRLHRGRILKRDGEQLLILTVDSQGRMEPVSVRMDEIELDEFGQPLISTSPVSSMPPLSENMDAAAVDALIHFLLSMTSYYPY